MVFIEKLNNLNIEQLVQLLVIALGGIIGFEREIKHGPAGLRMHMLVCLG